MIDMWRRFLIKLRIKSPESLYYGKKINVDGHERTIREYTGSDDLNRWRDPPNG